MSSIVRVAAVATFACVGSGAMAHTVWLEPAKSGSSDYQVMFGGHAGKVQTYDPGKLKEVAATDKQGKPLTVTRKVGAEGVQIHVDGAPAMITLYFDNGIHSRPAKGPGVEKPMNEVPGATRATYALKYHKTILDWSASVTRPVGQAFEVVPLESAAPVANRSFRVRVLQNGKPVAGVKLGRGEEGDASAPVTDEQGIASFVPTSGFNKLWAGKRSVITDNARYTELSYEYLFGFDAR